MKEKIPLATLVERLGKATNYPIGMNHLAVLIHGWRKKHPDQAPSFEALRQTQNKRRLALAYTRRNCLLSTYAGYDLTKA